jgi:ParB family transcriptional regulator, chromosome partitioning protein
MTGNEEMVAKAIGVLTVPTGELKANPHNPRRLFEKSDMDILRESIDRVGILVPLTVYKEKASGSYTILDGQRRWMCATDLKLPTVPVNEVAEPSLVQNIVTMFQIHKLRRDWELMPTALKLDVLIRELKDTRDKHLAALTGLDVATVVRCKKLLSYKKGYQDMMLVADAKQRVKADFFIELYAVRNDRYVRKFDWFDKNKFTDAMLKKMQGPALKSVTDFRVVKEHINNAVKANRIGVLSKRLKEFTDDPSLGPDHLNIGSAATSASARKILKSAEALYKSVDAIVPADYYGEADLWDQLERLVGLIQKKLRQVDRRAGA